MIESVNHLSKIMFKMYAFAHSALLRNMADNVSILPTLYGHRVLFIGRKQYNLSSNYLKMKQKMAKSCFKAMDMQTENCDRILEV